MDKTIAIVEDNAALTVVENNKEYLVKVFQANPQVLLGMTQSEIENFKQNFLSIYDNDYLLSMVDGKILIEFCKGITQAGLSLKPQAKQCYIVPYNTKVRDVKVMLPQAIIPLNGIQQMAYECGFMFNVFSVFQFGDDEFYSTEEPNRKYQSQLKTSNSEWFKKHFIGFDVVLLDLRNEIHKQTVFVEYQYLQDVTKEIKSQMHQSQTYRHKAARRAYGDFVIPNNRRFEVYETIEEMNDKILEAEENKVRLTTVESLGLPMAEKDGYLVISEKDAYKKGQMLKELGFTYMNKEWKKPLEQIVQKEEIGHKENVVNPPQIEKKDTTPAKILFAYLLANGLTKEQSGEFVSGVLGLSRDDNEEIEEVLQNAEQLIQLIEEYKSEAA